MPRHPPPPPLESPHDERRCRRTERPDAGLRQREGARRVHPAYRARRTRRAARPVGLRKDHRAADPGRPRRSHVGHRVGRRPGRQQCARQQARHGHGVPGLQPVPASDRARQRRVRPEDARKSQGRSDFSGRRHARRWSACRRTNTSTPASCRAASSSGSRWPGRWRSSRGCCCSTSRCPRWTPRCAPSCATRSVVSNSRSARRRCSSPTTRRRRWPSPTGSA